MRQFDKLIVGSKEEYERMQANKKNVLDFAQPAEETK
jgi:DNA-directed RNA polymerase subunit beta'